MARTSMLQVRLSRDEKKLLRKAARAHCATRIGPRLALSAYAREVLIASALAALDTAALGSMSEAEVQEITTAAMG